MILWYIYGGVICKCIFLLLLNVYPKHIHLRIIKGGVEGGEKGEGCEGRKECIEGGKENGDKELERR